MSRLQNIFRSLQYPNFRLYFIGQSISLVGTWMQRIAIGWLVYRLTHSGFMLGVVAFSGQIPTFLISSFGGVLSDRYDRYRILLTTQSASMLQAVILATLVLTGFYNVWIIIALNVTLGIINAFDTPARQSLMVSLVDNKVDLPNAIALNSSMVNLARLLGPTVAGIILASFGEGPCFLINAISFSAVITTLVMMKLPRVKKAKTNRNVWQDFKAGFQYLRSHQSIETVILMMACTSLFLMPFLTLLPMVAKDVLGGNAQTFGWLNGISGIGALIGAFYLASMRDQSVVDKLILAATGIFSITLLVFSFNHSTVLAMMLMVLVGFGMISSIAATNTFIQTQVSDEMRGRILSFYTMAFFGMMPIGSFMIGAMADWIGPRWTIALQGFVGLGIVLYFLPRFVRNRRNLAAA